MLQRDQSEFFNTFMKQLKNILLEEDLTYRRKHWEKMVNANLTLISEYFCISNIVNTMEMKILISWFSVRLKLLNGVVGHTSTLEAVQQIVLRHW